MIFQQEKGEKKQSLYLRLSKKSFNLRSDEDWQIWSVNDQLILLGFFFNKPKPTVKIPFYKQG